MMKKSIFTLLAVAFTVMLFGQAPVNYQFEILEYRQISCADGPGDDSESTWKLWVRDNTMGGVWQLGNCHFSDGGLPNVFQPLSGNTMSQNSTTATELDLRVDFWEDDCDGGTGSDRCSFSSSCLAGFQEDDDRANFNPFVGSGGTHPSVNFRDSSYCEWHTLEYSVGCFAFKVRFKWEYSSIDAGPALAVGCDDSLQLAATGSGTWSILSGGSGGFLDVEDPNTTFFGATGNLYTLQWSTLPGCMTNQSSNIDVNMVSSITPNMEVSNAPCENSLQELTAGDGGTYYWSEGSLTNYIDTTSTNEYDYLATGSSVSVYVTIESPNGCFSYDSLNYALNAAPIVDLGNDTTICPGTYAIVNATNQTPGLTQYVWSNGSSSSVGEFTTPGQYVCTLMNLDLCKTSDTIVISNFPSSNLDLGPDIQFCLGDVVTLDASTGSPFVSYLWSDGSTGTTLTVSDFDTVYITATDANTCEYVDSVMFSPEYTYFTLYDDTTIHIGYALDLEATTGVSYDWNTGDTSQLISVAPEVDTYYEVIIEQQNGCFMVGTVNVLIDNSLVVFVPNMFSPNGDMSNDQMLVYGNRIENILFKIYNRWGDLIFESNDVDEMQNVGWDGKFNNEDQPTGSYLWTMEGNDEEGNALLFEGKNSGTILLRR